MRGVYHRAGQRPDPVAYCALQAISFIAKLICSHQSGAKYRLRCAKIPAEPGADMSAFDFNDIGATIARLFNKGVRYSTVIDVGCADGSFFLSLFSKGFFADAVPLNIDAN